MSFELISFEGQFDFLEIDTSNNNIWKIGIPSKTSFDSAYSPTNGILTDTLNPYPVNNHSYFDIVLTQGEAPIPEVGFSLFINFKHKFDTDTLRDGGFITVSFDHGQTWSNAIDIFDPQWTYYDAYPGNGWYNENIYTTTDSLVDNNYGYSGYSGGWINTTIAWHYIPVKKQTTPDEYQQIVRFNFISDSIDTNKDGWLIDDIKLFSIDLGSFTNPKSQTNDIIIFPNPMQDYAIIKSEHVISSFSIHSLNGQIIKAWNPNQNQITIHKSGLKEGVYLIQVKTNNGIYSTKKLIVQQ